MDLFFFLQLARSAVRELWSHKYKALIGGFLIAMCVLIYGMIWEEKYTVSTTLYADTQNIIAPLLKGQAQVATKVEDQLQVVKDLMLSQRILEIIVQGEGFLEGAEDPARQSAEINGLRARVDVRMLGKNYIGVSFSDVDPDRAYSVVTQLVDLFIKFSSETKRGASKQAFVFIDKQVNSYKEQLRVAEERLKTFNATNIDGSEGRVQANIESLRTQIGELELDLGQARERVLSLRAQVSKEDRYLTKKARSDEYRERIAGAVAQLDELRLSFTDSHPDVIAMKEHIKALKETASTGTTGADYGQGSGAGVENPVYDELRSALAAANVEKNTITKRLAAMRARILEERERAKRIAARNAELAELTRDYDVTKGLYEDLLERKEKARLSMTLDIEGQGVTYKIQEPAKYPLFASGLRFVHFVIASCVAAIIIPVGLIIGYIFVDPRIRFTSVLETDFDVPVLGEIPHMVSNPIQRLRKTDAKVFIFSLFVGGAVYSGAVASYLLFS